MKVKIKVDRKKECSRDEILRMLFMYEYQNGTSRTVARELGWSKSKTADMYRECKEAGLTYEDAKGLTGEELWRVLGKYKEEGADRVKVPDSYWEWVCRELHSSKRKTLFYIWTESYSKEHPDGLGYSQFCRRYSIWLETASIEIILPQERIPGREAFIDWVGDTIPMLDNNTASQRRAYFFIATIGDSSFPFVEAFLRMDQKCWTQAHIDMVEFYGGVPRLFVPDNTKTAVTYANLYDPKLNHAYQELARHYEVGITPARVRSPNDYRRKKVIGNLSLKSLKTCGFQAEYCSYLLITFQPSPQKWSRYSSLPFHFFSGESTISPLSFLTGNAS